MNTRVHCLWGRAPSKSCNWNTTDGVDHLQARSALRSRAFSLSRWQSRYEAAKLTLQLDDTPANRRIAVKRLGLKTGSASQGRGHLADHWLRQHSPLGSRSPQQQLNELLR